ncbi:hypothetical protein J6590_053236 [Homalodisca vitripennis]|nr:hypothetical protein J6590_053236 [Homalodisca vitripennis]
MRSIEAYYETASCLYCWHVQYWCANRSSVEINLGGKYLEMAKRDRRRREGFKAGRLLVHSDSEAHALPTLPHLTPPHPPLHNPLHSALFAIRSNELLFVAPQRLSDYTVSRSHIGFASPQRIDAPKTGVGTRRNLLPQFVTCAQRFIQRR